MGQCLQILLLNVFLLLYQNKCKQPELQNKCAFKCHSEKKYNHAEICCNNIEHVVSDCCLMPTRQFFSYIMARTS